MTYYKILLVGKSGGGKTYSLANLDRDKTIFINVEDKPYPFAGQFKMTLTPKTVQEVFDALLKAKATSKDIANCIVVDSLSAFLDFNTEECKRLYRGYDIFTNYNSNIGKFNRLIKDIDKETIVTAHYEYVGDEATGVKEKRVKSKGKEWEGMIEKDYTIVIYTIDRVLDPSKAPHYKFRLVSDGTNSAKTPPDIFGKDEAGNQIIEIPNDARIVFDAIQKFKSKN